MVKRDGARDVVFLSGKRTGFGAFGGTLKDFTATDLGVFSSAAALEAAGVPAAEVGHTIFGNALQTSADAIYLARHIALRVGVPEDRPALTVNRLCGSGFEAVVQGAKEILLGDADVCLTGGAESMSQAPHAVRGARWGALRLGSAEGGLEDVLWEALVDTHCGLPMAETAEELAGRYGVTRQESDQFALESHRRALAAWQAGRFAAEVVPVTVPTRKGAVTYAADEHIRSDASIEGLAKLKRTFRKDGLVTAGNASGIGDGSASVVLTHAEWASAQ